MTDKYIPPNRSSMNQIGQFADPQTASFFAHDKRDSVHEIWLSWSIGSDDGHKIFQRTQFSKSFIGFEILQLDIFQFDRHFQAYFDISLKTWQIFKNLSKYFISCWCFAAAPQSYRIGLQKFAEKPSEYLKIF